MPGNSLRQGAPPPAHRASKFVRKCVQDLISQSKQKRPTINRTTSRSRLPDLGYQILATRSWLADPGSQVLDARSWMPDAGWPDYGCQILAGATLIIIVFISIFVFWRSKCCLNRRFYNNFQNKVALAAASVVERAPNCSNKGGRKRRCLQNVCEDQSLRRRQGNISQDFFQGAFQHARTP